MLFPLVWGGGGGGGGGEQQASCLVPKQAVKFPQVLESHLNMSSTEYGFAPYAYDVYTYMLRMRCNFPSITAQL